MNAQGNYHPIVHGDMTCEIPPIPRQRTEMVITTSLLKEARDLADHTFVAIERNASLLPAHAADQERVKYFLRVIERAEEGLRGHGERFCSHCPDARRWTETRDEAWTELKRTAHLYRVTEQHDPVDFWKPRYMEGGL